MKQLSLILAVALLASCKKEDPTPTPEPTPTPVTPAVTTPLTNGAGTDPRNIDAYLYSSYNRDVSYMSDFNQSMFTAFATSARNLMVNYDHSIDQPVFTVAESRGNADLGDVTFSGNAIAKSASPTNTRYFTSAVRTNTTSAAVWEAPKSGKFPALSINIDRGYPQIKVPTQYHISTSQGLELKIADYVSNYDSVSFYLSSSVVGGAGFSMEKKFGANKDSVIFTSAELSGTYPQYQNLYMSIRAYNYSNKTISDLKYVFELSNKITNKPYSLGY